MSLAAAQDGLQAQDVVAFWREAGPDRWFAKDAAFDAEIALRFMALYDAAARGELDGWARTAVGSLGMMLLLDQFPRNMFRDTARAFATDAKALLLAKAAILDGHDQEVDPELRLFFYLPFMHSEELSDQDMCVALVESLGQDEPLAYARLHRDAIARFGRFPHRNPVLGREMRPEETEYLANGGFQG
jgi:uncharacterized protein (DUF924 family)